MARRKFVYNRVLKLADYKKLKVNNRKAWEVAMALKTLRELGATSPDAVILGVGAAQERTIFELANGSDCRFVIPSDLYLDPGVWGDWMAKDFIKYPSLFVPYGVECEPWRILPRHADMTALPFPDGSIDAVFSSGSIEHVGTSGEPDYDAIAMAANEIGRVVKPGGIISLSTEWLISGNGWGWGHVRLFDETLLIKHIVEASGCELVDEPDWSFDGDLEHYVDLRDIVRGRAIEDGHGLLKHDDYLFTSVHIAMRKPE